MKKTAHVTNSNGTIHVFSVALDETEGRALGREAASFTVTLDLTKLGKQYRCAMSRGRSGVGRGALIVKKKSR